MLGRALGVNSGRRVRLVKGSHLVTRKFWEGGQAYLLQNTDKRVIFVNPYEGDLALIGTTDIPVEGRPEDATPTPAETAYLLGVLARYFRDPPGEDDIVHSFSGVRPLYDDSAENPSAVTRDYVFDIEPQQPDGDRAPLLSVFGGKITTYRKLAEHALDKLAPFFPQLGPAWTAAHADARRRHAGCRLRALAGGLSGQSALAARRRLPSTMAASTARVPTRCLPTRGGSAIWAAISARNFYEREARFLLREEWAETAEDILPGGPSTACTSTRSKPPPSGGGWRPRPARAGRCMCDGRNDDLSRPAIEPTPRLQDSE